MDNKKMAMGTNAMHICICCHIPGRQQEAINHAEKPTQYALELEVFSRPAWIWTSPPGHIHLTLDASKLTWSIGRAGLAWVKETRPFTVNACFPPAAAISGERIAKCAAAHAIQGSIVLPSLPRLSCLAVEKPIRTYIPFARLQS